MKVSKTGNSLKVTIPQQIAEFLDIKKQDYVWVWEEKNRIRAGPAVCVDVPDLLNIVEPIHSVRAECLRCVEVAAAEAEHIPRGVPTFGLEVLGPGSVLFQVGSIAPVERQDPTGPDEELPQARKSCIAPRARVDDEPDPDELYCAESKLAEVPP